MLTLYIEVANVKQYRYNASLIHGPTDLASTLFTCKRPGLKLLESESTFTTKLHHLVEHILNPLVLVISAISFH